MQVEFGRKYFDWSRQVPPPEIWQKVEKPAMSEGIVDALEEEHLKPTPIGDIRVLDVGVGGAKTLDLLVEMGISERNITGIDISPTIVTLARGIYPKADLRQANIADANLVGQLSERAPFHLITCSMTLNHLDDNQLAVAYANFFKLLVEYGSFVALVPYPNKRSKLVGLQDSEKGYWAEDKAPWGEKIVYRHRSFAAYIDYAELSGFFHSHRAFGADGNAGKINRLLVVGRKIARFKEFLDTEGLGVGQIDRHNYMPGRRGK